MADLASRPAVSYGGDPKMSNSKSENKCQNKRRRVVTSSDWETLLTLLPKNLDVLARQCGAFYRRREVRSASVLLRLLFLWVLCGFGLRSVAAWAARSKMASLTEGALRHRFRQCEAWLTALLARMLDGWLDVAGGGAQMRLVDASMLAIPGPSGKCWRVHAVYDPLRARLVEVELTDDKGGEKLSRAAHGAGDLLVADRGLAHGRGITEITSRGCWFIVRAYLPNLILFDLKNERLVPEKIMEQASAGIKEYNVVLAHKKLRLPVRLIAIPLPEAKAKAARDRLKRRAAKNQRTPNALSLEMAGFLFLLTTLPQKIADAESVMMWYRVRWQVELYFKRIKSILNLHAIQSCDPRMVKVFILAILLVASLIDRLNGTRPVVADAEEDIVAVEEIDGAEVAAASLWRLTQVHRMDLILAVAGSNSLNERLKERDKANKALKERPRQRQTLASSGQIQRVGNRLTRLNCDHEIKKPQCLLCKVEEVKAA